MSHREELPGCSEGGLARLKKLPTQAAPPQTKVRERKKLGTVDCDVLDLEEQGVFNTEHLLEKAQSYHLSYNL